MKIAHVLVALVVAAASVASAQTPDSKQKPAAAPAGDVEQTLMKLEREATAALVKRDAASFGRIFAEDAVLTSPDGTVQTKAQLVADVKSGNLVLESSDIADMKVHVHGETALVTVLDDRQGEIQGPGRQRALSLDGRLRPAQWNVADRRQPGDAHSIGTEITRPT